MIKTSAQKNTNDNKKIREEKNNSFYKIDWFILGFILFIALVFRLYKINTPLTDHHSWRQADTAAVARNFVRNGFDLLHPKYDDLSNIQSGQYNPQGYRFVEFPLYNALFAVLYKYAPFFSLEIYGRLVTVFFSLLLIISIYYLVLKEEGRISAFFGAVVFAVFPFFVFYSRVILPEMTALSLSFLSLICLYLYFNRDKKNNSLADFFLYFFSIIFMSLSLLIKPTTIFYFLPALYIFFRKFKFNFFKKLKFYAYFFISLIPLVLWRFWIIQFKEGIPFAQWLFFQVNTPQGRQDIFFRPAFFRWIFKERILNLILGGYLTVFFILGLLKKTKKSSLFFLIATASLLYLFVFQGGNVQHDYYQVMILPFLAIFSGIGVNFVLQEKRLFNNIFLRLLIIVVIFCLSFFFSYYQIRDFYSYNNDLVNMAKIIQTLTKPDSKIVTDTTGDTTLLYLSGRKGYPAPTKDFSELKKDGMEYFVTMNKDVSDHLKKTYELVFENDKVYILKL